MTDISKEFSFETQNELIKELYSKIKQLEEKIEQLNNVTLKKDDTYTAIYIKNLIKFNK